MTEAEQERAAIVAWLRRSANKNAKLANGYAGSAGQKVDISRLEGPTREFSSILDFLADNIEAGDHLK